MTDHANELRRHARKIPHPQGETPGVMLRAADEIERLRSESSRLQKEADKFEDGIDWVQRALQAEAKVEEMRGRLPCQDISKWPNYGAQPAPSVPDDMIEQAVNRFLSWKLPKDFHPDGGMVFIPTKGRGYDSPHWPVGTNLLNAQQAREMLRYVLAASPEAKP